MLNFNISLGNPVVNSTSNWIIHQRIKIIMSWEEKLNVYDALVAKCARFERKGKTSPFTSAYLYMFYLLNKAGEIGIRFSKEMQQQYFKEWNTTHYQSHGATMKGYVLIPEAMLADLDQLAQYLDESYDYVMSLKPK